MPGIYYDNTIDNLRLFERADLGLPGAELFLVGTDLVSPFFPGGDGRFTVGQDVTLAQALAFIGPARADIESHAFNCSPADLGRVFRIDFRPTILN